MNNNAFGECVLLHQHIMTSSFLVQADMASSILKGLVSNNGIDRLQNGNQPRPQLRCEQLVSPKSNERETTASNRSFL